MSAHSPGSQRAALIAARAALDKHADGVVVMDLRALSNVTDFFVVCTAGSPPQLAALKDHIERVLSRTGCAVWHTEGLLPDAGGSGALTPSPQWLLMDYGDVVVHLLNPQARAFYRLEELWADAPRLSIPPEPASSPARRESRAS